MRFEKSDVIIGKNRQLNRGTAEISQMLSEFLRTDFEVAEVHDWDEFYISINSAFCQFKSVIDRFFKGEVRVSKQGGKLFIARLEK